MYICDDGNNVFKAKKNLFVMQNLANLWANVGMGQNA